MTSIIEHRSNKITGLWSSLLISAIFPMLLGFMLVESFSDWYWSHYPFHTMVESVGALSALIIATLMVVMLKHGRLSRRYIMVACALIGMGLLDGFHAVLHVGVSFVWLHSIATMVGGILFAAVWLPESWFAEIRQRFLLRATIIITLFIGVISIVLPDILPTMVIDDRFSLLAEMINVFGGIGFLVGSSYFIYDYWQGQETQSAERKLTEDMVFANHCLLFGIAGLLFETSVLWDAGWWWWHVLRLLAYLVVLIYFFVLFKTGQDQLRESDERFRLINSRVPGIVYQFKIDVNGSRSLPYVSPTIEHYLGLSAEAVMNNVDEWFAITHPDDLPGLEASISKSMESMTLWEWEGRFMRENGEICWLRGSSTPCKLKDGSVVWDGVFIDITERMQTEHELQAKAMIIDQIHDSVVSTDLDGFITNWNKGSERLLGYTCEEMLGKHVSSLYPDDEYDFLKNEVILPLQEKGEHELEVRLRRKSGEDFYAHLSLNMLYDDKGNANGMIGSSMDVTERKQSEEELSKEKDKVQNYLDIVGVMLIALNDKTEVALINRKGCDILGYSEAEIVGKNWLDNFVPQKYRKEMKDVFNSLIKGEIDPVEAYENMILTKDGKEKLIKWNNIIFTDDDGKISGTLSSGEDITERKKNEAELDNYRHHLEDLVEERSRELHKAQDELVCKERLATLGQLTATVSHELRNPLGAMRPSIYILNKYCDKNDQRINKALAVVDRNINRCDRIIDELLDFTRITDLELHSTQIDQWLESVIDEQKIPKGIQLEKELSLNDIRLDIDADRLRRALINVIDNACQAMMDDNQRVKDPKSSLLQIKTQANDKRVEIIITDTGSGIAEDVRDKIFEPLFSTKVFGVGLGMATVKQIMEQHGGGIDICSQKNKGTTVTLWLPNSLIEGHGVTA